MNIIQNIIQQNQNYERDNKMKVNQISVTYGELRSTGYPSFSNKRFEITLGATVDEGEDLTVCRMRLTDRAKSIVRKEFGDKDAIEGQQDLPF